MLTGKQRVIISSMREINTILKLKKESMLANYVLNGARKKNNLNEIKKIKVVFCDQSECVTLWKKLVSILSVLCISDWYKIFF